MSSWLQAASAAPSEDHIYADRRTADTQNFLHATRKYQPPASSSKSAIATPDRAPPLRQLAPDDQLLRQHPKDQPSLELQPSGSRGRRRAAANVDGNCTPAAACAFHPELAAGLRRKVRQIYIIGR